MSDVFTTQEVGWGGDEWAKRLVERVRQNPLRRTRGARDFAELEDEIDRLHAENGALKAAVERVRALHEIFGDWCDRCNCVAPCPTRRALEGTP